MAALVSRKVFFTWTLIVALVSCTVKAADYGDPCVSDGDCTGPDDIVCMNSRCSCPQDKFYENLNCNLIVDNGATCSSTITNENQCNVNAHCVMNQAGEYKCLCDPAYYARSYTLCELRIVEGGTCFETSNCIEHADCVKEANEDLTGECTCNDGYTFKQSTSSCDSPSGAPVAQKIDVFLICMVYMSGVLISSVFI